MIHYSLVDNTVTLDPTDFYGQIQITASVNTDQIVDRMVSMGTTVSRTDILAVLELYYQSVEALVLEGARVNVAGIVDVYPRMQGVFNGITDVYDASRHQVGVTASAGARLRDAVRTKAQVHKNETIIPRPSPLQYVDLSSGTTDDVITPGSIGSLNGARLRFDPTKPDEGLYLIPTTGSAPVQITALQKNKPSQLVFLVPSNLPSGNYWIEVRARLKDTQELRSGRLDAPVSFA